MAHCPFSDESHGATEGYWCQFTGGHVDDSQNCNDELGYRSCPYCGNADILNEEITETIISTFSQCIGAASAELNALECYIAQVIRETSYERLYQAWMDSMYSKLYCRDVSTAYSNLVEYNMEMEYANELDVRIPQILSQLDLSVEVYRPSGCELDVSSYQLRLLVETAQSYVNSLFGELGSASFGGESKYFQLAQEQLQEVCEKMNFFLSGALLPSLNSVISDFESGMSVVNQARESYGQTLQTNSVRWEF